MSSTVQFGPGLIRAAIVLLIFAAGAQAKTAVIWLEGRSQPIRGELIAESPAQLTIRIAGIETSIERDRIRRVKYELSIAEQYKQRRAELDAEDYKQRYDLARWLYRQDQPQADALARKELADLLRATGGNMRQAQLLLKLVEQRIQRRAEAEAEAEAGAGAGGGPAGGAGAEADDDADAEETTPRYLSDSQRNLLKVMEVDLEAEPRIVVARDVAQSFFDAYKDDPVLSQFEGREGLNRYLRLDGDEKLELMFQARAREFYDQVIVRTEPEPLQTFRQRWSRGLVAGYCGQCHGLDDEPARGLGLYTRNANSEAVAYTNFLILNRTTVGGQPMINRAQPERSLLVQYALPREDAALPHPEVQDMRPYFRGEGDPRMQQLIDTIDSFWGGRRVRYPIRFEMPGVERQDNAGGEGEGDPEGGEASAPDEKDVGG